MRRRRGNSIARALFAGILSLALVLGTMGVSAQAYSSADIYVDATDSDKTFVGEGIAITAEDGARIHAANGYTADVIINGDLHYDSDEGIPDDAIQVWTDLGGTANVRAGNLIGTDYGVNAWSDGGTVSVEVGDIDVYEEGILVSTEGDDASVAVSAGNIVSGDEGIYADVAGGTITVTAGNIQSGYNGVYAEGYGNGSMDISVGDIDAYYSGLYYYGNSDSVFQTGDIRSEDEGVYVNSHNGSLEITTGNIESQYDDGVSLGLENTEMTGEFGDITANSSGIIAGADNSTAQLTAGNVQAVRNGVDVEEMYSSDVTIETGDITIVESQTNYTLPFEFPEDIRYLLDGAGVSTGLIVNSTVQVTTGNITSVGSGIGINTGSLSAGTYDSAVGINVLGDITADGAGIAISLPVDMPWGVPIYPSEISESTPGSTDIFVDGTISGGVVGIDLVKMSYIGRPLEVLPLEPITPDSPLEPIPTEIEPVPDSPEAGVTDTVSVTVWKIELNERGNAAEYTTVDIAGRPTPSSSSMQINSTRTAATEFEKSIKYIIKLEQPEVGGTLEATDADGNALEQSHDYDVAYEGDTVLLKVNLDEGYELLGAYNGDGEKVALLQDADGNYYVAVPKGGGVYLSVELEETAVDPVDPTPTPGPVNPWAYSTYEDPDLESMTYSEYVQFNEEVRDLVLKAAQGETVVVTTKRWMSFYSLALDALKARPDVTLIVQYRFAGKDFQFVIQAGTDCEALKNEEGYVGFLYFSEKLGVKAVTE